MKMIVWKSLPWDNLLASHEKHLGKRIVDSLKWLLRSTVLFTPISTFLAREQLL